METKEQIMDPKEKLAEAVTSLLLNNCLYGEVILRMHRRIVDGIPTMGVTADKDGNPMLIAGRKFVEENSKEALREVLAHECLHILLHHITRCKEKEYDQRKFNISADAAINCWLKKEYLNQVIVNGEHAELIFPETFPVGDGTQVKHPEKMSSDWYMANTEWKDPPTSDGNSDGNGENVDDHSGWEKIAGNPVSNEKIKQIAQGAVNSSANKMAGSMPGDLLTNIIKANESKVDWKKALRWFAKQTIFKDREATRKHANRRYGYANPGTKKSYAANVVVAADTSGSMSDEDLKQVLAEVDKIVNEVNELTFIDFDTKVNTISKVKNRMPTSWNFTGRGGTNFQPVIDYVNENKVDALIIISDMYAGVPSSTRVKTLWVGTRDSDKTWNPGFGKVIYIED